MSEQPMGEQPKSERPSNAPDAAAASDPPTVADVARLCRDLRGQATGLRSRPVDEICAALGRTGARFLEGGDPIREQALDALPVAAHLSPEMAREVLDGMARDWTEDRLRALLAAELSDPRCLDRMVEVGRAWASREDVTRSDAPSAERTLMAVGPALCVQIVSGSVPGVSVHALVRSLLVKAPTLLKPGRGDALLPRLFACALREEDPDLADALAVVYWPGGSTELEEPALAEAEVVVAYGSDETVEQLRSLAPATTRFVGYHHRVGVGVVGREALGGDAGSDGGAGPPGATAADVARAVALFEQRGCVCPQVVYVEEGGDLSPADFARLLGDALARLEVELPSPPTELDDAGAVSQLRGTAEIHAAAGAVDLYDGGAEGAWTVVFEHEAVALPPGGSRTVRVRPIDDAGGLAGTIEPMGPHLQSIGYAGLGERAVEIAEALGRAGASRITGFGDLPFPPPWWPHDGRGPLRELVRWVELERDEGG